MATRTAQVRDEDAPKVGSLYRGLTILDMFSSERTRITIGEMARALGIHKSSASRLAATLAKAGYLRVTESPGSYVLGSRLAVLGPIASQGVDLTELVVPHLEALSRETGETSHLAILAGSATRTISVVDGWHSVRMHSWVGKEVPVHTSAAGKALLAGLPSDEVKALCPPPRLKKLTPNTVTKPAVLRERLDEIRATGYSVDNEEVELGLRCIAAPIFSPDGRIEASVAISGPASRLRLDRVKAVSEHVRWAAWKASESLGTTSIPAPWQDPPSPPEALSWIDPRPRPA